MCKTDRVLLYEGLTIGHKHIAVLPSIAASRLELEVLDADGDPQIRSMHACFSE